jgi:ParB family chromosome partitioning protein
MFDAPVPSTKETPVSKTPKTPQYATTIKELATSRVDVFMVPPEALVLITDKAHPLYDERVHLPVDEDLVISIMEHGVLEPIKIRKNGDLFEVASGRQRTKAAVEANKRLKEVGREPISAPTLPFRGDDLKAAKINVASNVHRTAETPFGLAQKAQRLLDLGAPEKEVAPQLALTVPALRQLLKLFDCSPKVQKLVNDGQLAVATAAKLSGLDRKEQDKQVDALKGTVGLNRNTVRAAVKENKAAATEGREVKQLVTAPKRSIIVAVCEAYDKSNSSVMPGMLLSWVLTGAHADELPGPVVGKTLAQWIELHARGETAQAKA